MKLFKKRFVLKNGKGFSLVEVLCAIVLLAIVATPILQVIYSSMAVNIKSRKMLGASDLLSDTMEFVSSLTFEDYSYKDGDTTKYVPGLYSYYWGGENGSLSDLVLNKTYGDKLYPGGPDCLYSSILITNPPGKLKKRTLTVKDVYMDGMKYDLIITMENSLADPSADPKPQYYTYDVNVKVYNNNNYITEASTSIANKY